MPTAQNQIYKQATRQLIDASIRIESVLADRRVSTGSGFFFSFKAPENRLAHTIITNKHVLKGAVAVRIYVSTRDSSGNKSLADADYMTIPNPESLIVQHPIDNIDLAAISFSPIYNSILKNSGKKIFFKSISEDLILGASSAASIDPIHEILMIGYPNGLWDEENNLPLTRQGITATPIYSTHNGKNEFLIDCACFPGSSGSPVYVYDQGIYQKGDELEIRRDNFRLAGILYAGPLAVTEGNVVEKEISLAKIPIAELELPIHLGYCIRATEIDGIKEAFRNRGTPLL